MDGCTMKTTVEISDPLLRAARELALEEGVTLRTIIERGLRKVMTEKAPNEPFTLRDASVGGQGLQPEFQGASWEKIREAIYEGRGG